MHALAATPQYERAIGAVAELLGKLRLDSVFAGNVARSAWLGEPVTSGSIDAIAAMAPQQKNQVAMMASNRGFIVDKDEIEASEELDLVPMKFEGIRVHILVASNALYGRMIKEGVELDASLRVPRREDFALLLQMSNDVTALMSLVETPEFDREQYNAKLTSIGLRELVIPE
jgi:hypothetical protein